MAKAILLMTNYSSVSSMQYVVKYCENKLQAKIEEIKKYVGFRELEVCL